MRKEFQTDCDGSPSGPFIPEPSVHDTPKQSWDRTRFSLSVGCDASSQFEYNPNGESEKLILESAVCDDRGMVGKNECSDGSAALITG